MTYEEELQRLNRPPAPRVRVRRTGNISSCIHVAIAVCPERRIRGTFPHQEPAVPCSGHELTFIVFCDDGQEEQAAELAQAYMEPKGRYTGLADIAATLAQIRDVAKLEQPVRLSTGTALAPQSLQTRTLAQNVLNQLHHILQAWEQGDRP